MATPRKVRITYKGATFVFSKEGVEVHCWCGETTPYRWDEIHGVEKLVDSLEKQEQAGSARAASTTHRTRRRPTASPRRLPRRRPEPRRR